MAVAKEQILSEIERRLGGLDEKSREAVRLALELTAPEPESSPTTPPEWQGANPPFEAMAQLSLEARSEVMSQLEEPNKSWLEQKCAELDAGWLVVVDGQVLAHGARLSDNPLSDEQMLALCHQTGKLPLFYIHPSRLLIEETTAWNSTIYPNDFYPTLSVAFTGIGTSVDITADFDTGGAEVYGDLDFLRASGVVQVAPTDMRRSAWHLGQQFTYIHKLLTVSLTAADGVQRQTSTRVICVDNWHQSPLVRVNLNRSALVGRDLCLHLQPVVSLDFARHQTSLRW